MKKTMLAGVFIVLAALVGLDSTGVAAQSASRSWSVAVHIRYPDGFIYDHAFATGVSTSELPSISQSAAYFVLGRVRGPVPLLCHPE